MGHLTDGVYSRRKRAALSPIATALGGAAAGGLVGGLFDYADRSDREGEKSGPVWDGALVGAGLGGLAGYRNNQILNALLLRSGLIDNTSSYSPIAGTARNASAVSLADVLPSRDYRLKAQEAAINYRETNPSQGFLQRIDDKTLDRKVRYVRDSKLLDRLVGIPSGGTVTGAYAPTLDTIIGPSGGMSKSTLSHELTHAAQSQRLSDEERATDESAYHRWRNFGTDPDMSEYLGSPHEAEAYLSEVKRDYYRQTGRVVTTPDEARQALEWATTGAGAPRHQRSALTGYLQQAKVRHRSPESLLQMLSRIMPGLVSRQPSANSARSKLGGLVDGVYSCKQAALITFDDLDKMGLVAAGLAVVARDTGRCLMLQRYHDSKDPAGGMWEFPGGHIEKGEDPLTAAKREWSEETGMEIPRGSLQGVWNYGIYRGHVWSIARESQLVLHGPDKNRVLNPDDPDQDKVEALAWWKPELLLRNPAMRQELRASMHLVQKALDRGRYLEAEYDRRLKNLQARRDPDGVESKRAGLLAGVYRVRSGG